MIPKIIHYCWFGKNKLPKDINYFISTWKKYCPDYKIIEWNENNFDINQNLYCKQAYEAKKWAFVADYARLKILSEYGGIYMDTDVEVCKSFDDILSYNLFLGFESDNIITSGVIGACKDNSCIKHLLSYYDNKCFIQNDNQYDLIENVRIISKMLKDKYAINLNNKLQTFDNNYIIFPFEYFCAKDLIDDKIKKTENTYAIHHYNASWVSCVGKIRHLVKIILVKIFGKDFVVFVKSKLYKSK